MITELERLYFKYSDYIIIDDMLIDQLSKNLTTRDRFYANDVQKCANEQCENYLNGVQTAKRKNCTLRSVTFI